MATWVAPIDSQTDPDAPLTSELAKRWDNNVIAAFEGASGAQRLYGEAVARPSNGLPVLTVAAANTATSASEPLGFVQGTLTTDAASEVVAATYTIVSYTGSMRFKANHKVANGTGVETSTLRVYKNAVLVNSWNTSSTNAVSRSEDISFVPGDVIEWRHFEGGGTADSVVAGLSVSADDAYIHQPVFIKASS